MLFLVQLIAISSTRAQDDCDFEISFVEDCDSLQGVMFVHGIVTGPADYYMLDGDITGYFVSGQQFTIGLEEAAELEFWSIDPVCTDTIKYSAPDCILFEYEKVRLENYSTSCINDEFQELTFDLDIPEGYEIVFEITEFDEDSDSSYQLTSLPNPFVFPADHALQISLYNEWQPFDGQPWELDYYVFPSRDCANDDCGLNVTLEVYCDNVGFLEATCTFHSSAGTFSTEGDIEGIWEDGDTYMFYASPGKQQLTLISEDGCESELIFQLSDACYGLECIVPFINFSDSFCDENGNGVLEMFDEMPPNYPKEFVIYVVDLNTSEILLYDTMNSLPPQLLIPTPSYGFVESTLGYHLCQGSQINEFFFEDACPEIIDDCDFDISFVEECDSLTGVLLLYCTLKGPSDYYELNGDITGHFVDGQQFVVGQWAAAELEFYSVDPVCPDTIKYTPSECTEIDQCSLPSLQNYSVNCLNDDFQELTYELNVPEGCEPIISIDSTIYHVDSLPNSIVFPAGEKLEFSIQEGLDEEVYIFSARDCSDESCGLYVIVRALCYGGSFWTVLYNFNSDLGPDQIIQADGVLSGEFYTGEIIIVETFQNNQYLNLVSGECELDLEFSLDYCYHEEDCTETFSVYSNSYCISDSTAVLELTQNVGTYYPVSFTVIVENSVTSEVSISDPVNSFPPQILIPIPSEVQVEISTGSNPCYMTQIRYFTFEECTVFECDWEVLITQDCNQETGVVSLTLEIVGNNSPYSIEGDYTSDNIVAGEIIEYSLDGTEGGTSFAIMDANGCFEEFSYALVECPAGMIGCDWEVLVTQDCNQETTLVDITLEIVGSNSPYSIEGDYIADNIQVGEILEYSLDQVSTSFTIMDAGGCFQQYNFILDCPTENFGCDWELVTMQECDEAGLSVNMTLEIIGINGPYELVGDLAASNVEAGESIQWVGTSAGSFEVTISDAVGCAQQFNYILIECIPTVPCDVPFIQDVEQICNQASSIVTLEIWWDLPQDYEYEISVSFTDSSGEIEFYGTFSSPDEIPQFPPNGIALIAIDVIDYPCGEQVYEINTIECEQECWINMTIEQVCNEETGLVDLSLSFFTDAWNIFVEGDVQVELFPPDTYSDSFLPGQELFFTAFDEFGCSVDFNVTIEDCLLDCETLLPWVVTELDYLNCADDGLVVLHVVFPDTIDWAPITISNASEAVSSLEGVYENTATISTTLPGNTEFEFQVENALGCVEVFTGQSLDCEPTGIEEESREGDVILYPIPANDFLMLEWNELPSPISNLIIYDLSGRPIWSSQDADLMTDSKTNIEIAHLPAGAYLLGISTGSNRVWKRFVKQ